MDRLKTQAVFASVIWHLWCSEVFFALIGNFEFKPEEAELHCNTVCAS